MLPPAFVHTALNCFPLSASETVKLILPEVAPVLSCQLVPAFVLICHCTVAVASLVASLLNVTEDPSHTAWLAGDMVTAGGRSKPVSYTHLDVYKRQVLLKEVSFTTRFNVAVESLSLIHI